MKNVAPLLVRLFPDKPRVFLADTYEKITEFAPIAGNSIIALDEALKKIYGDYEDDKTSMSDFIKQKFGDEILQEVKDTFEIK